MPGKYSAQQKYNRKTYVRLTLDLKPDVKEEFQRVCAENGTTATTEIKRFIAEYCQQHRKSQE